MSTPTTHQCARQPPWWKGAATFGPLLAHWLGSPITRLRTSSEFNYAVATETASCRIRTSENHLFRNHELAVERIRAGDYLGCDISLHPERLTQRALEADYDSDAVKAVYRTAEIGIDPTVLASLIRDRVASEFEDPRRLQHGSGRRGNWDPKNRCPLDEFWRSGHC